MSPCTPLLLIPLTYTPWSCTLYGAKMRVDKVRLPSKIFSCTYELCEAYKACSQWYQKGQGGGTWVHFLPFRYP